MYTQNSNKTSFSCYDDKRYLIDDGRNTLASGHKDISNNIYEKNIVFLIYNNVICRYY